ncbi:MAG: 39S ribosomal protein L45 [gamma proteobacterium symbiont of Lucinoma myriamae]|nr:39S ribosomal protein L45 [gamma proteobacterium symbiont of Lucinoma myriamae]
MNKHLLFSLITFISIAFFFAANAEAKRFGGGSSFGSKKSYSSPFKQSTRQKSFSQQKATATNQQRKQQMSKQGGLMGMLGGLALGGLLGALFFGGAFENFNLFDFLIIGGIIWGFMWFMKRKALTSQVQTAGAGGVNTDMGNSPSQVHTNNSPNQFKLKSDKQDATFSDNFSADSNDSTNTKNSNKDASFADSFGMDYGQNNNESQSNQQTASEHEVILPGWFNQEEFLTGAHSAYKQLQYAWDMGDLQAIKGLTTDKVYSEIARQLSQETPQGETRILQLNAELIDFNESDDHSEASVLFDALLDEEATSTQGRANQVRELWHFIRGNNSSAPTWYLDGIQQLE